MRILTGLTLTATAFVIAFGAQDHAPVAEIRNLQTPMGVAADPQSVPFLSTGDGRILHLLDRNNAVPLATTGGHPAGMAFDAAGDLFVADSERKAILKITPWGAVTVAAGQIDAPARVASSVDGQLYFTDTKASRVYRMDKGGAVSVFTSEVRAPTGIVVSSAGGYVFVGDGSGRIWKVSPDGKQKSVFATLQGPGEPAGMMLDEQGNLYVARDGGGEVTVLSPAGKPLTPVHVPGKRVTDVALGGPDLRDLYVSECDTGTIYKLRAPFRVQRLPWEPGNRLRILEPIDGAVLNQHDGQVVSGGLRITVRGKSPVAGSVRVNGAPVQVRQGAFETSLLLRERETKIRVEGARGQRDEITVLWDRDSFKRYRVSTDDNVWCLRDIARHADTYKSIFDTPYLALWRDMHRKYGTKVHFNIYYEAEDGFNLTAMPAKFRSEWQQNADWIRLTFHARANEPGRPYLHGSAEQVREDYRKVTREIERFAGKELLSNVTTVHWGALTRAGAQALRAEGMRTLVGYFKLSGDAPIVSYYLPREQWVYLTGRDYWKDTREDILFVRHDVVMNSFRPEQVVSELERITADPHQAEVIELMIHEQYFYPDFRAYEPDYRQRVESGIEWVTRHGYKPVFFGDGLAGAPSKP